MYIKKTHLKLVILSCQLEWDTICNTESDLKKGEKRSFDIVTLLVG